MHYGVFVGTNGTVTQAFNAEMVEVRLALGGERDWDFNWTAFYSTPDSGSTLMLLGAAFTALGLVRRRTK